MARPKATLIPPIIDALGTFHEDFTVVQTPEGLRAYFILFDGSSAIISETALSSVINTSIK